MDIHIYQFLYDCITSNYKPIKLFEVFKINVTPQLLYIDVKSLPYYNHNNKVVRFEAELQIGNVIPQMIGGYYCPKLHLIMDDKIIIYKQYSAEHFKKYIWKVMSQHDGEYYERLKLA